MDDKEIKKLQDDVGILNQARQDLEKKYEQLFNKVRQMRGRQKEYFKWRASSDLQEARRFEREVDALIDQELKIQKSNQTELFNGKES